MKEEDSAFFHPSSLIPHPFKHGVSSMPQVCRVCSHLNPDSARYCYHDGAALAGGGQDGPIAVGARPFFAPFVFPSGKSCRTFDELVLACETDWDNARDMMQ